MNPKQTDFLLGFNVHTQLNLAKFTLTQGLKHQIRTKHILFSILIVPPMMILWCGSIDIGLCVQLIGSHGISLFYISHVFVKG